MTTINREQLGKIRKRFCDAGQGHVFTWWDDLTTEEHDNLYRQLASIDLDLLKRLIEENLANHGDQDKRILEPPAIINLPRTKRDFTKLQKAVSQGESVISSGQCAAFVAAGSGESDLGLKGVKGLFPITPVTGKSLFQLHTEKVLALRRKYEVNIPLFVMTSVDNHQETKDFFEKHDFFGLSGDDIYFFSQGMLPAVELSGKLIMENRSRLHMNPDGHGGAIRSLYTSGALDEMEERGVKYIFYFQVDNPLVKILDPAFIGYHDLAKGEISSKVVRKKNPEERVGILAKVNDRLGVVEHTDLTKEEMYARDEKGELLYFAGNIAIHILNVDFVRRLSHGTFKLPFHKSEKSINHIDDKGEILEATSKNAVKFESFVFDALRFAEQSVSLEVPREEEFSPFKNLEGEDSPEICRRMMSAFYKGWLRKADFKAGGEDTLVEISPLFALDADEFCSKVKEGKELLSEKLFIE